MDFEGLLQDVGENLTGCVLDIDANQFGPNADAYIETIKNNITNKGYEIVCVLRDTEQAVYQLHIKRSDSGDQ